MITHWQDSLIKKKSQIEDLDPNFEKTDPEKGLRWYDIQAFGTEGQGWSDTQRTYARLPAKAEDIVRDPVWQLAQHSAGICVRFVTSARAICELVGLPHYEIDSWFNNKRYEDILEANCAQRGSVNRRHHSVEIRGSFETARPWRILYTITYDLPTS